jgi:hypothetical protein
MSISSNFITKYSHQLELKNNEYIISNPNIKNSLINFFEYFDNQFFLTLDPNSTSNIILQKYFEYLDEKKIMINKFINSFSKYEIEKIQLFYLPPNLINFTALGDIHNLLFWFYYYKTNNYGDIDSFINELRSVDEVDLLEKKFYDLGFIENPKIELNYTKYSDPNFINTYPDLYDLFYNLFDNLKPISNICKDHDYLNLIFLFNILESKITLINHYYKTENQNTFKPLIKTFQAIVGGIQN